MPDISLAFYVTLLPSSLASYASKIFTGSLVDRVDELMVRVYIREYNTSANKLFWLSGNGNRIY